LADESWTGGYVVDVEYTHGYYPDLAPLNLAMAASLAGRKVLDPDQPFTYLELGCGNGFSSALLAAANPQGQFWANDFNPAHIANARATAQAASIDNVIFLEASFEELAETEMPDFDIIALHGIWSWVSPENRHYIIELIRRRLKAGGLVFISYNCLPGWSRVAPLRRLLKLGVTNMAAPAEARVEQAFSYARAMRDVGAGFFTGAPHVGAILDHLAKQDRAYLAHEYLNDQWGLFYQDEVADALLPAKLSFLASARLMDGFDQFNLTPGQQAMLNLPGAPSASQVVRDFLLDRRFRRDLYGRRVPGLASTDISAWFARRRFALARPRSNCPLKFKAPGGEFDLTPKVFDAVLDALVDGPEILEALSSRSGLVALERRHLEQAVGVLCALDYVHPALSSDGDARRRVATDRFNHAALRSALAGRPVAALASPVTGSGVPLPPSEQVFLAAIVNGQAPEAMVQGLAPGTGSEQAEMLQRALRFQQEELPLLKSLQVV
jgi:SAM-dependent methyltransferase